RVVLRADDRIVAGAPGDRVSAGRAGDGEAFGLVRQVDRRGRGKQNVLNVDDLGIAGAGEAGADTQGVIAATAIQEIVVLIRNHRVGTAAAGHEVVAGTAIQRRRRAAGTN